ncbi:MAG: hypothetical protein ACLTSL_09510 [Odoribacter splanchnicus]
MEMFWIIIIIVIILVLLTFLLYRQKRYKVEVIKKNKITKEILESKVDFQNIFKSSFEATSLYNELKILCHPDKFIVTEKKEIATKLFQEITSNKYDYKKLLEIKQLAKKELLTDK